MSAIDYSQFKKVSSDKNTTTLQHKNGHELKVAHKGLSPELKKKLDALPGMDQKPKRFKNGGVATQDQSDQDDDSSDQTNSSGMPDININLNGAPQGQQVASNIPSPLAHSMYASAPSAGQLNDMNYAGGQQGGQPAPTPTPPPGQINGAGPVGQSSMKANPSPQPPVASGAPQSPEDNDDGSDSDEQDEAQAPGAQPQGNQTAAPQQQPQQPQTFDQHKQAINQDLNAQAQAYQNDLINGHVTPKTYKQLFDEKSTLGKIGTIFGLIVGGAGAGLTHTENPMTQMMDKEIERDLQSQIQSKTNAQNFYKINLEAEMNQAKMGQMQAENQLTGANTVNTLAEAKIKAATAARMQTAMSTFHQLTLQSQSYPVGSPQWQSAQRALAIVGQQMGDKIMNANDLAASAIAFQRMLPGGNQAGNSEQDFQNNNTALRLSGPMGEKFAGQAEQKHISGIPEVSGQSATRAVPEDTQKEIQDMTILDKKGRELQNFIQQHTGSWNPSVRAQAAQKVEEMKNFYNGSIKGGALTQGRLGWYDEQFAKNPTDIVSQLRGSNSRLQEMINSNYQRRNEVLKNYGYNPQPVQYKNGVPYVKAQGGWKKAQ